MAKTQVLQFFIYLPDKALVDTLNSEMDAGGGATVNPHGSILVAGNGLPNGLAVAPTGAAITANLLVGDTGSAPILEQGDAPASPAIGSEWFTSTQNFPRDVATFTRKAGGWFGIPLLFGETTRFYWTGRFVYRGLAGEDQNGEVVASPAPIPDRYWCQSFETPQMNTTGGATGNGGSQGGLTTRDAGGFIEGYGMAVRGNSTAILSHVPSEFNGVANPQHLWERFYITVRAFPTVTQSIHATLGTPTSSNGTALGILPSGQLAYYIRSLSGTALVGTSSDSLELNRRYRIDILTDWSTGVGANNGRYRVYRNGVRLYDSGLISTGPGASGVQRCQQATLDPAITGISSGSDATYEADFDYWHGAGIPNNGGTESLNSVDWINGSRAVLVEADAQAGDFANWTTGKYRSMTDRISRGAANIVSTTANAVASFTTNAALRCNNIRPSIGVASINVGVYGYRGTNSGEVGWNINSDGDVYKAVSQAATGSPSWKSGLMAGPGSADPIQLETLEIKYKKGNDTVEAGITNLCATIELIGIFSDCDVLPAEEGDVEIPDVVFSPIAGVHNSAYPETPWANTNLPAFSPYHLVSGTYVGNGVGQDIEVKAPPLFIAIRRVTGTGDLGGWWWTSMLGGHMDIEQGMNPFVRALLDPSYGGAGALDEAELRFLVRISGSNAQVNTNAATYHYFVVCDPGARFHLAHAATHNQSYAFPASEPLALDTFTPEGMMALGEDSSTTTSERLFLKDAVVIPAGSALLTAGAAVTASVITFGTGEVIVGSGMYAAQFYQVASLFYRHDDGNGPFETPPFQVIGWTGDGAASRSLALDLGGKRPLWAIVAGNNGAQRDPSHTSTNSSRLADGTQDANGITAGAINGLTVGATLNASGQPYVMIVYPGSTTAGNNGWSIDGEFWPISPDSPKPADWEEPEVIDNGGGGEGGGEGEIPPEQPDLDDTTALPGTALFCLDYTTRLINRALQRAGINKKVADVARDLSAEAVMARTFIKDDVEVTLAAFPWAFATEYVDYDEPESGSITAPVNRDWTYRYALPVRNVFARRLVSQVDGVGRKHDPNPITFRTGLNETTGHKLFTNAEATDVVPLTLEYTKRVGCPTYFGDRWFKEALCWKFAASFAMSLSKDSDKAEFCEKMFRECLPKATAINANEQQAEQGTTDPDPDWITGRN